MCVCAILLFSFQHNNNLMNVFDIHLVASRVQPQWKGASRFSRTHSFVTRFHQRERKKCFNGCAHTYLWASKNHFPNCETTLQNQAVKTWEINNDGIYMQYWSNKSKPKLNRDNKCSQICLFSGLKPNNFSAQAGVFTYSGSRVPFFTATTAPIQRCCLNTFFGLTAEKTRC